MVLLRELFVYRLPDAGDFAIYYRPSGKATDDPVIDKDIGMDLPRSFESVLVADASVIVAVDGKELKALALAPINGILQQLP